MMKRRGEMMLVRRALAAGWGTYEQQLENRARGIDLAREVFDDQTASTREQISACHIALTVDGLFLNDLQRLLAMEAELANESEESEGS